MKLKEIRRLFKSELFENEKQKEIYIKENAEIRIENNKIGILLLIILNHVCNTLDFFVYPEHFKLLLILRIIWTSLLVPLLFLFNNRIFIKKNYRIVNNIWGLLAAIPICLMIYFTDGSISPYYAGLNLVIIGVSQFLGYTFLEAVRFSFMTILFYILSIVLNNSILFNIKIFYNNLLFIILTSTINAITCHIFNIIRIKDFKNRYRIKEQKERLEEILRRLNEAREQLFHSEKMNALGFLSAGILHEVNNPLNFVMTYSYILLHKKGIEETKKDKILKDIYEGLDRIKNIIANLRQFAHTSNERKETFLIKESLEAAKMFSSPKLGDIRIIEKINKDFFVTGSKADISQVFINLFVNSADELTYLKENNPDMIPVIIISISQDKDRVLIKFWDNGSGISSENFSNIFTPFFTTKKQGKGMGLGLSISYRIIKDHGGELKVKSKKGKWTEFSFDLPTVNSI